MSTLYFLQYEITHFVIFNNVIAFRHKYTPVSLRVLVRQIKVNLWKDCLFRSIYFKLSELLKSATFCTYNISQVANKMCLRHACSKLVNKLALQPYRSETYRISLFRGY